MHGLGEHPVELSLEQIGEMRKKEQITLHHCIQGWSGIAEWGGLPFSTLIDIVFPDPEAQGVMFSSLATGAARTTHAFSIHRACATGRALGVVLRTSTASS